MAITKDMMTRARKWLVAGLLMGVGALACGLHSTATLHVNYATGQNPAPLATFTVDEQPSIVLANDPFRYQEYHPKLRPGIHTLVVQQGPTRLQKRFLYLHVNATIVEYRCDEHGQPDTWLIWPHLGRFRVGYE